MRDAPTVKMTPSFVQKLPRHVVSMPLPAGRPCQQQNLDCSFQDPPNMEKREHVSTTG